MSHGREKSDCCVVPEKLPNKAMGGTPAVAEVVEGRRQAKGNAFAARMSRRSSRVYDVGTALEGIRQTARGRRDARFDNLLFHIYAPDRLRAAVSPPLNLGVRRAGCGHIRLSTSSRAPCTAGGWLSGAYRRNHWAIRSSRSGTSRWASPSSPAAMRARRSSFARRASSNRSRSSSSREIKTSVQNRARRFSSAATNLSRYWISVA